VIALNHPKLVIINGKTLMVWNSHILGITKWKIIPQRFMEIFSSGLPLYHHSCGVGHGAAPALGAPELGALSCSGFLASGGPCVFDFRETWPGWIT